MRVYCLAALALIAAAPSLAQVREAPPQDRNAAPERKIHVDLAGTPLRTAIRTVFTASGLQYSVDPGVPDVAVDLQLRDVSLQQALRLVVRQAAATIPGLSVAKEQDVYVIRVRAAGVLEPGGPNAGQPYWRRADVVSEKIPLRHIDAATISVALGGKVVAARPEGKRPGEQQPPAREGGGGSLLLQPVAGTTVFGLPADNSLVVLGARADIDKLRSLMQYLDVPAGQFSVQVTAGSLSASGLATGGARLRLSDAVKAGRMDLGVTPRLGAEGVALSIDGQVTTGGASRSVATHVTVRPGVATPVVILGGEGRELRIWVKVTLPTGLPKRQE